MRWPGFLLLPLLLVACTDTQPVAPIEDGPVFNWMNNLDNGNVQITRYLAHFAACWSDDPIRGGLRVCHATLPLSPPEPDCGLQALGDPIDTQEVGDLIEPEWWTSFIHAIQTGETWVTLRDESQVGACFGSKLLAQGWGEVKYVDNSVFGSGLQGNNANAWSFRGRGNLIPVDDGSAIAYKGHAHIRCNLAQVSADNPFGCKVTQSAIKLD